MKLFLPLLCLIAGVMAAIVPVDEDRFFGGFWKKLPFGRHHHGPHRKHSCSHSSSSSSEESDGPEPNIDMFFKYVGVTVTEYTAAFDVYLNQVPDQYKAQFQSMISIIQGLVQNYWENWDQMAPLRTRINPEIQFTILRLREFVLTLEGKDLDSEGCISLPNGDTRIEVLQLFKTLRDYLDKGLSLFVTNTKIVFDKLDFITSKKEKRGNALREKFLGVVFTDTKNSAAIFQLVGGYLNTVQSIMISLQSTPSTADTWAPLRPIKALFQKFWRPRLTRAAELVNTIFELYDTLQAPASGPDGSDGPRGIF